MDPVSAHFSRDHYAVQLTGITLLEAGPGRAVAQLQLQQQHLNSLGMTHGGALFTLADFAFAVASNYNGRIAVGIETSMSFLKATSSGILTATALEISQSYRISHCDVRITNEAGELVAVFHGVAARKSAWIAGSEPDNGPAAELGRQS